MAQIAETEVIPVWPDGVPESDRWHAEGEELERPLWENSRIVRNVSVPTITVFLPEPSTAVGTGVLVCPGGGFHFLMVDKEGTDVAKWLNARGVAAFMLKYRLTPTPDDDEMLLEQASDLSKRRKQIDQVWPVAVSDGLQAMRTLRQHVEDKWGIRPDRLGIVGFSAGGAVAVGVATQYDQESRPSFAAPIYAPWEGVAVPADVPPVFLATAGDDEQVDARSSLALFSAWKAVGRPAELHIYSKGGHGFGLIKHGLPSDYWIDQFWAWLQAHDFVPSAPG